jgi:DNA-binding transcriptional ArsR family regulator
MPKPDSFIKRMTGLFKALGDPTRLRIIRQVASKKERLCVAEIAGKIGISVSAVSQHLKVLRHVGVVDSEKEGNLVYYRIVENSIRDFGADIGKLLEMAFSPCGEKTSCEECPKRDQCK